MLCPCKFTQHKRLLMRSERTEPLVSIIMNCYNGEMYLKEAIDSIYSQSYRNWEIIFWDNGSTDKTPEIVKQYDNRLRYFHSPKTAKLYTARNLALEKCSGEFVTFLDCDDLWKPEKLKVQVSELDNNNAEMIYSSYEEIGEKFGSFKKYSVPNRGRVRAETMMKKYRVGILTVVIRASVIRNNGLRFCEGINYAGDYGMFLKVATMAHVISIRRVLAQYRVHDKSLGQNTGYIEKARECDVLLQYIDVGFCEKLRPCFQRQLRVNKKQYLLQAAIVATDIPTLKSLPRIGPNSSFKLKVCWAASFLPSLVLKHIPNKRKSSPPKKAFNIRHL
jgi:glycosyltransferase involved in cell wall biosynthesis